MTWAGALQLKTLARYAACDGDLMIVGLEDLGGDELAALRERAPGTPMIAIGSPPVGVTADRVLAASITSRELKQAIRELLARR